MGSSRDILDLRWMDKIMRCYPPAPRFFKFCNFFFRKGMRYKDMFLILYGINRGLVGEKKAEEVAINKLYKVYKEQNV